MEFVVAGFGVHGERVEKLVAPAKFARPRAPKFLDLVLSNPAGPGAEIGARLVVADFVPEEGGHVLQNVVDV